MKADIEDYLAFVSKVTSSSAHPIKVLEYTDITLSHTWKITASQLLLSKHIIPYYHSIVDTCVDKLMVLRNQLNAL